MAEGANHQGVIAEAAAFCYMDLNDLLAAQHDTPAIFLVLDHLSDPQNLGTLLRTAEAIGAHGVVIPRERSASITPAVEKASAGAVEHLPIAQVVNLPRALDTMKERGIWIFGLDASATEHYDRVDYDRPVALVVGSEGRGLSRLAREHCDFLVKLPMRGKVASLNAAVAGSIVLYHVWRIRRTDGGETARLSLGRG
jgi:23S rRNA (guanosine2251-2'-O)-methyltransferase